MLVFVLSTSVCNCKEYSTQEELKKIADDTQKCIDANFVTDYAMAQCTIEGTKKYGAEIEKTVKAAEKFLSKAQYKQFLKTQAKWEKFVEKHDKTKKINYPPYQPYLLAVDEIYEYTKDRAIYLNKYIEGLLLKRSPKP